MKVALLGYEREGEASYRYWSAKGADITIYDNKEIPSDMLPNGVATVFGPDAFEGVNGYDLVIRTPGLSRHKIESDSKIWTSTNEFFTNCPAPIIGVTGTKGKGTTASLIASILTAAGVKTHLVGNIGQPALDVLSEIKSTDVVVYELSSFQLWDIEASPHVAVVLMIEQDHLDVHRDIDEYVEAKANIVRYQNGDDIVVYNALNKVSTTIAANSQASKVPYPSLEYVHVSDGYFYYNDVKVCPSSALRIPGNHNIENACAAITAVWSWVSDPSDIERGIESFHGLEHRLELVNEVNGITYYNDSYSSAPGATIAAVRSFTMPIVLIAGGFDRGIDFSTLADTISSQRNIKKVILIGQTANKIGAELTKVGYKNFEITDEKDLRDIVTLASKCAISGDVVLFSPGCPGYDMFDNFSQRGQLFKRIVKELA